MSKECVSESLAFSLVECTAELHSSLCGAALVCGAQDLRRAKECLEQKGFKSS